MQYNYCGLQFINVYIKEIVSTKNDLAYVRERVCQEIHCKSHQHLILVVLVEVESVPYKVS